MKMFILLPLAIVWSTGLVCATYLIAHELPWWGMAVAVLGLIPSAHYRSGDCKCKKDSVEE